MHEWLTGGSRIKAVVGHFGSGKTEIALNAALYLRALNRAVKLIDLDIVNPFFRSAEQKDMLRAHDIEAIYPEYALSAVDIPVLGPEILRAFEPDGSVAIFDVGGDESGAAALGRYKPQLDAAQAEMYYVINPCRPRSRDREQILRMMEMIALRSRLSITGIIANTNLAGYTTAETLAEGRALIREIAQETGVPVVAECGLPTALEAAPTEWEPFAITRYLKPEWMDI
jgi:hypothetical protein